MVLNILELKLKTNYSLVDDREDAVAQLPSVTPMVCDPDTFRVNT
jgi:hypothetical protein